MRRVLLISVVCFVVVGVLVAQSVSFLTGIHAPVVRRASAQQIGQAAAESLALKPGLCGGVNGQPLTYTRVTRVTLQSEKAVSSSGHLLYPQGGPWLLNQLLPKDFWTVELASPDAPGEVVLEAYSGAALFCGGSGSF